MAKPEYGKSASLSLRLYSCLLYAYPPSFRSRFGADMADVFGRDLGRMRGRGRLALLAFWVRTCRQALVLALAEHWENAGLSKSAGASRSGLRDNACRKGSELIMSSLAADIRLALRLFAKHPLASGIAAAALAIGIGLSASAFGILHGTLLRGLPFERSDELVHFSRQNLPQERLSMAVSFHDYWEWKQQQTSFEGIAAFVEALILLPNPGGPPERLSGVFIEPEAFSLLRVEAQLGRIFSRSEQESDASVILLSHRLWQQRFGADPAIVGSTISVNQAPAVVVGVMPEGFGFPIAEQFWLPLRAHPNQVERGQGRLDAFGRLNPGTDLEQAQAEFAAISRRLQMAYPESNRDVEALLQSFEQEYVGEDFSQLVLKMLLGALLVLLVACANTVILLLARASVRSQEFAMRAALGASAGRLARQMAAESLILACIGAAGGIAIAYLSLGWFARSAVESGVLPLPHGSGALFWWDVAMNWTTAGFLLGLSLAVSLLIGLAPARLATRYDLSRVLNEQARGTSSRSLGRVNRVLVVAEVAMTSALLVVSALTAKSLWNVSSDQQSFSSRGVVTARIFLPVAAGGQSEEGYPDHASRFAFWQALLEELNSQPGILKAAAASHFPTQQLRWVELCPRTGAAPDSLPCPETGVATVSAEYFEVFQVPLLRGRPFRNSDDLSAPPVAIVNESFVARRLAGKDPLGHRLRLGPPDSQDPQVEIVGVVPDLWRPENPRRFNDTVYVPIAQSSTPDPEVRLGIWGLRFLNVAVKGRPDAAGAGPIIRQSLHSVANDIPLRLATMDELIERRFGSYQVAGRFYQCFGLVALFLACLGIYGVFSFAVTSRSGEIGIRMALGASSSHVVSRLLRQAGSQVLIGIGIGAVIAYYFSKGLQRFLFQVELLDPAVWAAALGLAAACGLLASWMPARRAARIDPMRSIRQS